MRDERGSEDYEVGYGKPPESGKFKKGVSGNPLGRPKNVPNLGTDLIRELNQPLVISENGQRKTIKKHQAFVKQLVNKTLSGHLQSARLLLPLYQAALASEAEERQRKQDKLKRTARELTDEELTQFILEERDRIAKEEQSSEGAA